MPAVLELRSRVLKDAKDAKDANIASNPFGILGALFGILGALFGILGAHSGILEIVAAELPRSPEANERADLDVPRPAARTACQSGARPAAPTAVPNAE